MLVCAGLSRPVPFYAVLELTEHSSRCPCHHMLTVVQFPDVFSHVGPSDAGVTLDVHVVSQSQQHLNIHREREPIRNRDTLSHHLCSHVTGQV